jgi:hypothetical protein
MKTGFMSPSPTNILKHHDTTQRTIVVQWSETEMDGEVAGHGVE